MNEFKIQVVFIYTFFLFTACNTANQGLFGKQNPHDQYAQKLKDAGLTQTVLGQLWMTQAEKALSNPTPIQLPYKEIGFFAAEKPRAVGLQFKGKRGEKLSFQLDKNASGPTVLYADLWEVNTAAKPSFIRSIDSAQRNFELEIEDDNTSYILRLQPELLKSVDYTLSISIGPSLAFPVSGNKGRIASVWGDNRDAGARRHEGIDIFAPKRTPAIAAADGTVTSVNENNLGGLVVWLRPKDKNYTLYYAHLDEQLATPGQRVAQGDTIGLIGNTGNARSTPPHLHLGIYAAGGAIDPLPFVNPSLKKPAEPSAAINLKEDKMRLTKSMTLAGANFANTYPASTIAEPIAATAKTYRVVLPSGFVAEIEKGSLQAAEKAIKQIQLKNDAYLLDEPKINAPRIRLLSANTTVAVLGLFESFQYVKLGDAEGWLPLTAFE